MRASPRPGTSSYLQGLAPKIEFQDRAKVAKTGLSTCTPLKCYDDVLLIDELKLERHAYKVSRSLYGRTRPARRTS